MKAMIVLVTSATDGIGRETIEALFQSSNPYQGQLKSQSFSATNPAEFLQVDVNSDEYIDKAFQQVKNSMDRLDVVISKPRPPQISSPQYGINPVRC